MAKRERKKQNKTTIAAKKKQFLDLVKERAERRTLKGEDVTVLTVEFRVPASPLLQRFRGGLNVVFKDRDGSDGIQLSDYDNTDQWTKMDKDPSDILHWFDKDSTDPGP